MIVNPRYATQERGRAPETAKAASCDEVSGLRYYNPTEGRWLNRDPMGEPGGENLYCFVSNSPIEQNDDTGEKSLNYEAAYILWVLNHPGLSDAQYAWVSKELRRGCVGITIVFLGQVVNGYPDTSHCYSKRGQAKDALNKRCDCGTGSTPQMFSIHLWNNEKGLDGVNPSMRVNPSGQVDLSNWSHTSRPGRFTNYDFGYVLPDGEIIHANHADYPGDPMYIDVETLFAWKVAGLYPGYNAEVWCVACNGGSYGTK